MTARSPKVAHQVSHVVLRRWDDAMFGYRIGDSDADLGALMSFIAAPLALALGRIVRPRATPMGRTV